MPVISGRGADSYGRGCLGQARLRTDSFFS